MADDFQYVKLPSGEYGKFRSDASDDVIRSQIMKDFPLAFESQKQQTPDKPIASTSEMIGEGEEVGAQGNAELGKQYVQAGPMEVGRGVSEIAHGNIGHGIHRAFTGAGVTALPAIASTLPIAAATAPVATAAGLMGGAALSPTLKYGASALGANEDWSNVAGDVGTVMGGYGGAKLGGAITPDAIARATRTPTGELKPLVHAGARIGGGIVGGGVGAATGIPYAGYGGLALGGAVGPEVADALLPKLPESPLIGKGPSTPISQSPYYNDILAARSAARGNARDIMRGNPSPFDPNFTGQDLISRSQKIRIAGESPSAADLKSAGDMTQVPDDVVETLAKQGDMIAKNEWNSRRLKGQLGIIKKLK